MRIDHLTIHNFKKFTVQTFTFHPQFTLLVGDNGAGKTSPVSYTHLTLPTSDLV